MKDTVRLSRPPKPVTKETVRLVMPPPKYGPEERAKHEDWMKRRKPSVEPPPQK